MSPAVGSAAAGSGGVTGDAEAAVWGAVQLQPGVRAGGKRFFFLQRSLLHLKRLLHSPLLFIMTGWVLLSPQEDGVGTLWTDLSLSNPGCFIGSCKAQTGSLRMASFSEERRLCGNRGIRVE